MEDEAGNGAATAGHVPPPAAAATSPMDGDASLNGEPFHRPTSHGHGFVEKINARFGYNHPKTNIARATLIRFGDGRIDAKALFRVMHHQLNGHPDLIAEFHALHGHHLDEQERAHAGIPPLASSIQQAPPTQPAPPSQLALLGQNEHQDSQFTHESHGHYEQPDSQGNQSQNNQDQSYCSQSYQGQSQQGQSYQGHSQKEQSYKSQGYQNQTRHHQSHQSPGHQAQRHQSQRHHNNETGVSQQQSSPLSFRGPTLGATRGSVTFEAPSSSPVVSSSAHVASSVAKFHDAYGNAQQGYPYPQVQRPELFNMGPNSLQLPMPNQSRNMGILNPGFNPNQSQVFPDPFSFRPRRVMPLSGNMASDIPGVDPRRHSMLLNEAVHTSPQSDNQRNNIGIPSWNSSLEPPFKADSRPRSFQDINPNSNISGNGQIALSTFGYEESQGLPAYNQSGNSQQSLESQYPQDYQHLQRYQQSQDDQQPDDYHQSRTYRQPLDSQQLQDYRQSHSPSQPLMSQQLQDSQQSNSSPQPLDFRQPQVDQREQGPQIGQGYRQTQVYGHQQEMRLPSNAVTTGSNGSIPAKRHAPVDSVDEASDIVQLPPKKKRSAPLGGPFIHAICGKAFNQRRAVKNHHWGSSRSTDQNEHTTTGCWFKNGKPDIAWDSHPTCYQPSAQSKTAARRNNATSHKTKPALIEEAGSSMSFTPAPTASGTVSPLSITGSLVQQQPMYDLAARISGAEIRSRSDNWYGKQPVPSHGPSSDSGSSLGQMQFGNDRHDSLAAQVNQSDQMQSGQDWHNLPQLHQTLHMQLCQDGHESFEAASSLEQNLHLNQVAATGQADEQHIAQPVPLHYPDYVPGATVAALEEESQVEQIVPSVEVLATDAVAGQHPRAVPVVEFAEMTEAERREFLRKMMEADDSE